MKKIFIFILIIVLLAPATSYSATLTLDSPSKSFGVGDTVPVFLRIDAGGDSLNAIDATLTYPVDLLEFIKVSDASSIVTMWVEKPSDVNGTIHFTGIVPGGFSGVIDPLTHKIFAGQVFEVQFKAKAYGNAQLSLSKASILKNDGKGSELNVAVKDLTLVIDAFTHFDYKTETDTEMPIAYKVTLSQNTNIFSGKWFISFVTADVVSGIDHYEVKEDASSWYKAESPYVLQNQNARSISVKAVDGSGNERIVTVAGPNRSQATNESNTYILIIIGILILSFIAYLYYVQRQKKKNNMLG